MKLVFLIIFLLSFTIINAQNINTSVVEIASKKSADNIYSKVKNSKNDLKIIVLPFYDEKGNKTEHSENIGKTVAHQLNSVGNNKITVWYYTDFENADLTSEVNKTDFGNRNSDYYTQLLEKFSPDFIISGSYSVDNIENKFHITNVNLYQNWTDDSKKMIILSAENVTVDITEPNKTQYLWRSALLPGWGQMQKQQKAKGTSFMITTGVLLVSTLTFQTLYSINYDNYLKELKYGNTKNAEIYKSNSDALYMIRNVTIIGFCGFYGYNLIDALTSKRKNYVTSLNFYPNFYENQYYATMNIRF